MRSMLVVHVADVLAMAAAAGSQEADAIINIACARAGVLAEDGDLRRCIQAIVGIDAVPSSGTLVFAPGLGAPLQSWVVSLLRWAHAGGGDVSLRVTVGPHPAGGAYLRMEAERTCGESIAVSLPMSSVELAEVTGRNVMSALQRTQGGVFVASKEAEA